MPKLSTIIDTKLGNYYETFKKIEWLFIKWSFLTITLPITLYVIFLMFVPLLNIPYTLLTPHLFINNPLLLNIIITITTPIIITILLGCIFYTTLQWIVKAYIFVYKSILGID